MAYKRKTIDVYEIVGRYQGNAPESVDEFYSLRECREMLKEYRLAFGEGWVLGIKRRREIATPQARQDAYEALTAARIKAAEVQPCAS